MKYIRKANPKDTSVILELIKELAQYEKLSHEVVATEALLHENLFGSQPKAEVLLAERDGKAVGFALFFHNFSTFLAQPGIYLEDLYVKPQYRKQGLGFALFKELVRLANDRKCGRLEWAVLDWNEPAIEFYKKLGAKPMSEWTVFRLIQKDFLNLISNNGSVDS